MTGGRESLFSGRFFVALVGAMVAGCVLASYRAGLLACLLTVAVGVPAALVFINWPALRQKEDRDV